MSGRLALPTDSLPVLPVVLSRLGQELQLREAARAPPLVPQLVAAPSLPVADEAVATWEAP